MKSITIRDLRQKWPEAEAALEVENEIVITRDGKPVARLLRMAPVKPTRKRWNATAHLRWLKKTWGDKKVTLTEKYLLSDRDDRKS